MNNQNHYFSAADGMLVQEVDLRRWRKVLNAETFARLQQECIYRNAALPNTPFAGYDVFRGDDILQFIINQSHMR